MDDVDYTNKFSVELRDDEEQLSLPPTNRYQDKTVMRVVII